MQKSILEWLWVKYPALKCWKHNSAGTFSFKKQTFLTPDKYTMKGVSDIVGIFPSGIWLAIEVKVKGNERVRETTVNQDHFLEMIKNCGGVSMKVYTIEDVEREFKKELGLRPGLLNQFPPQKNIPFSESLHQLALELQVPALASEDDCPF